MNWLIGNAMNFVLQPWHLLVVILAGYVDRYQQQVNEFQQLQIEALLKQLGKKRVLLSDDQRRLLAVKGKALGRKALSEITTTRDAGHDSALAS